MYNYRSGRRSQLAAYVVGGNWINCKAKNGLPPEARRNAFEMTSLKKGALWFLISMVLAALLAGCLPRNSASSEAKPRALRDFNAALKGKGTHGTVACVEYPGRRADLEGLLLKASLSRGGEIVEGGIPAEAMDGEICFELTDAKYVSVSGNLQGGLLIIPPDPLTLLLEASTPDGEAVQNGSQALSLGPYVQFPFLRWIFPTEVKPACVADGHTREGLFYPAWDIIPEPSPKYPSLVGTPLLAPVDGTAYVWLLPNEDPARRFDTVNAVMIYSPDTGFVVDLTHAADIYFDGEAWVMLKLLNGQKVSAGSPLGVIGPKDHASSIPHVHLQVFIPAKAPSNQPDDNQALYAASTQNATANVDAIKQRLFLDQGLNQRLLLLASQFLGCEGYPWGELLIPQQLALVVDGNREDWANDEPVLSDKSGDSTAGETMDIRALSMKMDDNYLYLLLEAGPRPAGRWGLDFFMDFKAPNACGSSERSIKVWSDEPGAFTVGSVDGCPDSKPQTYPALFAWAEALEVRIPLVYLNNPSEARAISVKGILVDGQGRFSYPDYMR